MGAEMTGRKVFILNPHSVIKDELIAAILAHEYEIYALKDPERAKRALVKLPDSILFVNIDSMLRESEWEQYIRSIKYDPVFKDVRIGILSYNSDAMLAKKYLMTIGVRCGFIQLRLGVKESAEIMVNVLEANEAKGRRKYVRARAEDDNRTTFNLQYKGRIYSGPILDISSVGMALQLSPIVEIPAKTVLTDIQLRLRAAVVRVTGVVLGSRGDDESIRVVLFKYGIETKPRSQIRQYIHENLQQCIDKIISDEPVVSLGEKTPASNAARGVARPNKCQT